MPKLKPTKTKMLSRRAAKLLVVRGMVKPITTMVLHTMICQVRSFQWPDVQAILSPIIIAKKKGGRVKTNATVRLYSRLNIRVGMKF